LIIAALGGTYAWTQTQYFVGRDGSEVAIFRGVNTQFGPLKFFSVYKNYDDLKYADLTSFEQGKVSDGLTASSRSDAERVIRDIRTTGIKPPCPPSTTPAPPTTSTSPPASSSSVSHAASSTHSDSTAATEHPPIVRTTSSSTPFAISSSSPENCRSNP